MARQQTDMCSKLVKESYKKAFQRNALHGTYELGRLAAELKVIPFWSFDLLELPVEFITKYAVEVIDP